MLFGKCCYDSFKVPGGHGQRSLVGYSLLGCKTVEHDWATNTHIGMGSQRVGHNWMTEQQQQ